jgi:hypothetical protein
MFNFITFHIYLIRFDFVLANFVFQRNSHERAKESRLEHKYAHLKIISRQLTTSGAKNIRPVCTLHTGRINLFRKPK